MNYGAFTLGIEEEIHGNGPANAGTARSHEQRIVEHAQKVIKDKVKAEMHQAVVEVGIRYAPTSRKPGRIAAWRAAKTISADRGRAGIQHRCGRHAILSPNGKNSSSPTTQGILRWSMVNGGTPRGSNLIFRHCMYMWAWRTRRNGAPSLPTACVISCRTSSRPVPTPLSEKADNTGFESFRSQGVRQIPAPASPIISTSIEEYDNFIKLLVKTNWHRQCEKVWWDLRVHPFFNTVESAFSDVPLTPPGNHHAHSTVPVHLRKDP